RVRSLNDQIAMTNQEPIPKSPLGHWSVVIGCLLVIGAWSLVIGCDHPASPQPATAPGKVTVASLVPAATDVIVNIGAADHLVAISNWDPKTPDLDRLPRVGDYRTVDWEKLAEVKPALMIVQFAPGKMPAGLEDKAKASGIKLLNVHLNR